MRAAGIVRENTKCEEVKMSTEVIGIEKPVVIDRKQNLREHRLYWVGRRTQDVVLSALALVVLSPVMLATDRKSTRLNSSHSGESRMPSSA